MELFKSLILLCREPFDKTGNRYCIVSARDALFYLERRTCSYPFPLQELQVAQEDQEDQVDQADPEDSVV